MRKLHPLLLCLSLLLLVGVGAVAYASTNQLTKDVVAAGGGFVSAGDVTIEDTIGQPVIGEAAAGDILIESGFWDAADDQTVTVTPSPRVFLPIFLK